MHEILFFNFETASIKVLFVSQWAHEVFKHGFDPRRHEEKMLHESMKGEVNQTPLLSIFKSIQPIDMKLSMCNKCPIYF